MISKILVLMLSSALIISCSLESPIGVEKIDQIKVTDRNGDFLYYIELSDEITLPVELDEFVFILEDCFDISSFLSEVEIELEGNEWKTHFPVGFTYRFVTVNRYSSVMVLYDF